MSTIFAPIWSDIWAPIWGESVQAPAAAPTTDQTSQPVDVSAGASTFIVVGRMPWTTKRMRSDEALILGKAYLQ